MRARWAGLTMVLAIALQASTARAESPVQLSSLVESGAMVPTSSTKQLLLSLQVLVPFARSAGTRWFAGFGPRAMTQELLSSNLPELISVGLGSSFHVQF